jgi:hypothetical protein
MEMSPTTLPDKTPLEKIAIYLQLDTGISPLTIVSVPVFDSDPAGLVFSGASAIDDAMTAAAYVTGGDPGTVYAVSALCTLSSGEIVQPCVALPVVSPAEQAVTRRNTVL